MTEWNLSVRLTGQGSDLTRTLRNTARDARDASRQVDQLRRDISRLRAEASRDIRVRVRADARTLRADVRAALSAAGSGQRLGVRLGIDAAHLRADVQAALTTAGAGQNLSVRLDVDARRLRTQVQAAVRAASSGLAMTADLNINTRGLTRIRDGSRDAAHSLNTLQRAAREAKNELEELEARSLTTAAAIRRINTAAGRARGRLDDLSGSTRTFRTDLDDLDGSLTRVGSSLTGLRGRVGGLGGGSGGGLAGGLGLGTLIPLATAAIPLVAGLSTSLAVLPGVLTSATVPAIAFGVALAGQVGPLSDAADAEKKYQEAVRDHGRGSVEAAEAQLAYQRQLASMPPEAQRASVALSQLKTEFGAWSDDMAQFTMEPVEKSFVLIEELLPRLSPQVESFSTQLNRLMDVAGGGIASGAFDQIADDVARLTDSQLDAFTDQVIHLLRIISEGEADDGVIGQIVDYMRENGPEARAALDAIGDAIGTLAEGAAQAGPTMLTLVTAAAKLVAALPPEVVAIILQAAAALKLLQLAGAGAAAVAAGYGRIRTSLLGLAAASTAAGGGLAGLRAAFLALGTAAKASVVLAGIGALVYAVSELSDMGEQAPPNVDRLTTALGKLGATGKVTGEAASAFGKDFGKLHDQIDKVLDPSVSDSINNWGADITNGLLDASDSTEEFNKSMDSVDESLTNLVRGGKADLAAAALENMLKGMNPEQAAKFKEGLDGYKSAVEDLQFEQELAAQSMGVFGKAASDVEAKLNAQKTAADGLRASILALNDVNRSAHDAEVAFEQGMDDLTAAFKENGNTLDVHTEKGRANREAMSQAAAAQDEMIAAGLAAGESFESLSGKSDKLRESMLTLATQAFDGNRAKAVEYVNTLLGVPEDVKTQITLERQEAIAGLQSVQDAIDATPDSHTVTVDTLNATAIAALEAVGLKTKQLPDGRTEVYTANGQALGAIGSVSDALSRLDGKTARTYTTHTTTFYERHIVTRSTGEARRRDRLTPGHYADGAVVDYYADGGIQRGGVRHFATGSENHVAQIAPAGSWRVWGEPETMGEAYVPFAPSKRVRSRAITEEVVRRLGGNPAHIEWNADGNITDWRYDPASGSLYSPSDAGSAGRKTKKVKGKEVSYFDLGAVERKLVSTARATAAWNRNLEKVADLAGGDVAQALASMGKDGEALAAKMAKGSKKYVAQMSMALRELQKTARATLTDYRVQMQHATNVNEIFAKNLAKLAAQGYGDLAAQLAAQNDLAAQQLAAEAADNRSKASKANAEARRANNALTSDQVQQLVQIIAAIKTSKTGIHDVAATTGLGEDEIIAVANRAKSQISSSLGSRSARFLADLAKANKHQAYADGGIRAGLYATQGGIIRFAEPSTRGEAYIPLGENKRRSALPVLSNVASRFGLGLTDGQASRVVIIREQGPLVGQSHFHIGDRQSDRDLARAIEARQSYQLRRLARGGVGSRG